MKVQGARVLVTGASSGIGRATAVAFARAGAHVALLAREEGPLQRLAEELASLPGRRLPVVADVREPEQVRAAVERTVEAFGGVDVLVSNAGVGLTASIAQGRLANMRHVVDVNLFGTVHAVQAVYPHMREQRRGVIVIVSSVAGRIAMPYGGVYSATKAGLIALADALRLELAEDGIRVVTVLPGYTSGTSFGENSLKELHLPGPSRLLRGVPASLVGRKVLEAVERERREVYVTFGDRLAVGLRALLPGLVDWGLRRIWLASRRPRPLSAP